MKDMPTLAGFPPSPAGVGRCLAVTRTAALTHPVLEEIVRARLPIRPEVFKRWQQTIERELLHAPVDAVSPDATVKKGRV